MRILFFVLIGLCSTAHAQTVAPHHRFDMTQNGQKMSAHDFEQWMTQRGLRIVGRKNSARSFPSTPTSISPPQIIPAHNRTPVVDEKIHAAGPGTIVGF